MVIGISLNIDEDKDVFDKIPHNIIEYFQRFNTLPLLLPNSLKDFNSYFDHFKVAFLVLSGGISLSSVCSTQTQIKIAKIRDSNEKKMLEIAITKSLPVLGICRGMHFLNEYFDGALKIINNNVVKTQHIGVEHEIQIEDTYLIESLGFTNQMVNSFHNFGMYRENLGNNLISFCHSKSDGVIEGFYHETYPILAIQWHPERSPYSNKFNNFIISNFLKKNYWWLKR